MRTAVTLLAMACLASSLLAQDKTEGLPTNEKAQGPITKLWITSIVE